MNKKSLEIFAKLQAMLAIQDVQIAVNPKPYLEAAYDELCKARDCFEAMQHALSPDIVFEIATENDIRPTDIQGEAYIRCNAALKILNNYLSN